VLLWFLKSRQEANEQAGLVPREHKCRVDAVRTREGGKEVVSSLS
jgi:hypothetical protein